MQPLKKTFAMFANRSWSISEKDFEISHEGEAVRHALETNALYFQTYEVTSVILGGKELKGDPENYSGRGYVGVDKVYTRDEVIAEMRADKFFPASITNEVISYMKEDPADRMYMNGLERYGEYTPVKEKEKVFDSKGRQLLPKP